MYARICLFNVFCKIFSLKLHAIFAFFSVLFCSISLSVQSFWHTKWANDVFFITFRQFSVLSIVSFSQTDLQEMRHGSAPCWRFWKLLTWQDKGPKLEIMPISYPSLVEKELFLSQILEIEILKVLQDLKSPETF